MKQVLHHLATGAIALADVPAPQVGPRQVLIANQASVISAGTERMLVAFGRANWLDRARQQPERVRQVLDKARTDGVAATARAVRARLDAPLALGYSSAGIVLDVGREVTGVAIGDRVVSNGGHAELVAVPQTLCARVPEGVAFDNAAYTVLAAIGLQGVRLAAPELGEAVVVSGLGVIGLLTVQILAAAGCRVAGIDPLPERLALAERFGATPIPLAADDPVARVLEWTSGRGADAVLVAAATESSEPVRQAARMSRKRGRVVLIGAAGTDLERSVFYERELSFQVSCSYGPGRYDPQYEEAGYDYPLGYVRWTEQRNFEAIIELMAAGRLDPSALTTHRFPQARADAAYDVILGAEPSLGVVLEYPPPAAGAVVQRLVVQPAAATRPGGPGGTHTTATGTRPWVASGAPRVAVIGAGHFAGQVLVPAITAAGARLVEIVSARGASAAHLAARHGFARCATDVAGTFAASDVDAVFIATRHDTHAALAAAALAAGKSVYVEKPLALSLAELEAVRAAWTAASARGAVQLMVGFNRRFAPHVVQLRAALAGLAGPRAFVYVVNAGALPGSHWTQDRAIGGGRIVGEACHMIDLLRALAGAPITGWHAVRAATDDVAILTLRFADGSIGAVHYLANGNRRFPKERLEVFAGGSVFQLDNFARLTAFGRPLPAGRRSWVWGRTRGQDKGHAASVAAFLAAVPGGPPPIPPDEIFEVSGIAIQIADALAAAPAGCATLG